MMPDRKREVERDQERKRERENSRKIVGQKFEREKFV